MTDSEMRRFTAKINKNGPIPEHAKHLGRCWVWIAGKFWCGYGCFTTPKKTWYSHRLAHETFIGEIPKGMWVLHKCDNRACVNPDHLFLGNNQDNVDDKIAKGRNANQQGHEWRKFIKSVQPRGEKSASAKLCDKQVLEMRKCYVKRSAQFGTTALAKKFGIPCSHVWSIVNRKAWIHI